MNERLKYLRTEILNVPQKEMAMVLGITVSSYSRIENKTIPFRDAYMKVICATYSVSEKWLKYGVGEPIVLSTKKTQLLDGFDRLSPKPRKKFLKMAQELLDIQNMLVSEGERVTIPAIVKIQRKI